MGFERVRPRPGPVGAAAPALAAGALAGQLLAHQVRAEDAHGAALVPGEAAVRWEPGPPSLPKGVEVSRLAGDPAASGPFVLRLPAGTVIAPHTHATAETLTVLSGSVRHGMGRTLDRAGAETLTAGGFVSLPADMPHSLWTADGPAVLQVNGTGPFGRSTSIRPTTRAGGLKRPPSAGADG